MSRKEFLKTAGMGASALLCAPKVYGSVLREDQSMKSIKGKIFKNDAPSKPWKWSIEGFHYASNGTDVQCQICPNRCYLEPGDRSVCRSKVNIKGKLYSLAYGNPSAIHIDPVEKKPLFHFYPGTTAFSMATAGCNFRCLNCQNWEISQRRPEDLQHYELFPEDVIKEVRERKTPSIAYTYSEAVTFYEYMIDTARLAREAGVKNILVSNGYINKNPLLELTRYIDGANIDFKSYDDRIYRSLNGGELRPILNTLITLHEEGVWLELATLVIPGYVDDPEMIKRMCGWILKELGPDYPLHFLRFFPLYKLTRLPPTPVQTLEQFRDLALREGIRYVYIGNVPGHEACNTYCHNCGNVLIERKGYLIKRVNMEKGRCLICDTSIPGKWEDKGIASSFMYRNG